jgi:chorismate synthase
MADLDRSKVEAALAAFHPEQFGFAALGDGWVKEFDGFGPVVITPLGWPHAQSPSYDAIDGSWVETDALGLIANLQTHVWGFPPELVVPTNVMAIIPDGGGSVLACYRLEKGFNADGWLGFIIGLGARNGNLVSHMLAIREDARGAADFGWNMKLIQGYEALKTGHHAMSWTFDPMRGANAKLNLEKLGAIVREFTLDKYGVLRSALYRNAPSDRFTAYWDLLDPRTAERLAGVRDKSYRPLRLADIAAIDEATVDSLVDLASRLPDRIRFRIPGDVDAMMETDAERVIEWREEMRKVLTTFLTAKWAKVRGPERNGPVAYGYESSPGRYIVNDFVTERDETGERVTFYVLKRLQS